ncbi:MAG: helix-turn-helix transcriptional regulator [Burkholderiaceae bacterium]
MGGVFTGLGIENQVAESRQDNGTLPHWASIDALQMTPFGLLITSACGLIRFVNDAARRSLILGSTIQWVRSESLFPFDHKTEPFIAVTDTLAHAKFRFLPVYWNQKLWVLGVSKMQAPQVEDERDLIAITLPRDRASEKQSIEYFVRHHRLTVAESEILAHLRQGLPPQGIAQYRSVSEHTVRTQIRSILDKVGISRVSDLLQLADSLPSPGCYEICTPHKAVAVCSSNKVTMN